MGTMSALPSASFFWSLAQRTSAGYCPQVTEQDVSSPRFLQLLAWLLNQASKALAACPTHAQILSAGMRSVVIRVRFSPGTVDLPGLGEVPSVILKYFRRKDSASNSGGFGYLREKHGLGALDALVPGLYTRLLAADDASRLLILEDIKSDSFSSVSLGELLLSSRADTTSLQALDAWAFTWANILGSPAQATAQESFAEALAEADPQATAPGSIPSPQLAFKGLALLAKAKGVALDSEEFELWQKQVGSIISPEPDDAVLSSGDFSPANLLLPSRDYLTGSGNSRDLSANPVFPLVRAVRAIDAEGSCIHHWALPVAEMMLGFPSWPKGPVSTALAGHENWQLATQKFYRLVAPYPHTDVYQAPAVRSAVLTIQAVLAEQLA